MKVEEFERYLTEEELEMFKSRLLIEGGNYTKHLYGESTVWGIIASAFAWDESPQGQDFWSEISQRKRPVR